MLYVVEDADFQSTNIDQILEYCIDDDYHDVNDDDFPEWIDERYGYIDIGADRFLASDILRNADAYDAVADEYIEAMNDSDYDEARWSLRHATVGDVVFIQRYTVHCREEEVPEGDTDGDDFAVDQDDEYPDEQPYNENEEEDTREYALDALRQRLMDNLAAEEAQLQKDNETENSYLDLFQKIG